MKEELIEFAKSYIQDLHILCRLLSITDGEPEDYEYDLGFRRFFYPDRSYKEDLRKAMRFHQNQSMTYFIDFPGCYFTMISISEQRCLLIGPYALKTVLTPTLHDIQKYCRIPRNSYNELAKYYQGLPEITPRSNFNIFLSSFANAFFGSGNYHIHYSKEYLLNLAGDPTVSSGKSMSDFFDDVEKVVQRYDLMKELSLAVQNGQTELALTCLSRFFSIPSVPRFANSWRENIHFLTVFNTTLRNAIWDVDIHPYWVDLISREMTELIENIPQDAKRETYMRLMIRSYCKIVQEHRNEHYSGLVQHALLLIEQDFCADLSLSSLAKVLHSNPSYLSRIFRHETGQCLTDYVNSRRLEKAATLLRTTEYSIQEAAESVGVYDTSYFSRIFRKQYGKSPTEYRKDSRSTAGHAPDFRPQP